MNMVKKQTQEATAIASGAEQAGGVSSFPSDATQANGGDSRATGQTDDVTETTDEPKYTQAEIDRIVNDRLTRERTKHAAELKKQEEAYARRDRVNAMQDRLRSLSYEGQKTSSTYRLEAPELAEVWADLPEDEQNKRIAGLHSAFASAVESEINERIKSPAPKLGASPVHDPVHSAMGLHLLPTAKRKFRSSSFSICNRLIICS